jgi:hypothetical protein
MMVLEPLPVVISGEGVDEINGKSFTVPFSPKDPKMGDHEVKFSKTSGCSQLIYWACADEWKSILTAPISARKMILLSSDLRLAR